MAVATGGPPRKRVPSLFVSQCRRWLLPLYYKYILYRVDFKRHAKGILYLSDYKYTMKRADAVQVSQSAEDELLVILHITGIDLKLIVIIT